MRERAFQRGKELPDWRLLSSANTGKPKVWCRFMFGNTVARENISIGDSPLLCTLGILFWICAALRKANDHRQRWIADVYLALACSNCFLAISDKLRIFFSALSFLKMCINRTNTNGLIMFLYVLKKYIIREPFIVSMIMLDNDIVFVDKRFEGFLGCDGVIRWQGLLKVYIGQSQKVIHKDCCHRVAMLGKVVFKLINKARERWLHLVDWNTVTRSLHL